MTPYFATCARGLEPVLAGELCGLRSRGGGSRPRRRAVSRAIRPCSTARTSGCAPPSASCGRSSKPRSIRPTNSTTRFADHRLVEYLTPDHTLAVDCNVRDSAITHSQYAARRVKDAICDQFRERIGRRPSVDVERPMVGLNLHISQEPRRAQPR